MSLRTIFTENLKSYRKKSGMSQQQLAERCDIATNYLSEIERAQKFPSVELIERLSLELDVAPYLFFIDGKTQGVNTNAIIKKRDEEFSRRLIQEVSDLLREYGFMTGEN